MRMPRRRLRERRARATSASDMTSLIDLARRRSRRPSPAPGFRRCGRGRPRRGPPRPPPRWPRPLASRNRRETGPSLRIPWTQASRSPSPTPRAAWCDSRVTSPKPAPLRMASTRPASAKAKGPGAPGWGGSKSGNSGRAASSGMETQGLSATARQHTKTRRPPGRSERAMLAKAASGSLKNITPKREKPRSKAPAGSPWGLGIGVDQGDGQARRRRSLTRQRQHGR